MKLERKNQPDETPVFADAAGQTVGMLTPPIDEDYWLYRVKLSETQAIVGFPKFGLVGIGFQVEEDWNTNLPSSTPAEAIFAHISHNKGDETIADEDCIEAIRLIQQAARDDRA